MLQFNENEKITPTVLRRRVATVERELKKREDKAISLKNDLDTAQENLELAKSNFKINANSMDSLSAQLASLQAQEEQARKKANCQIATDHAVVQYIERVLGIDVQEIRNHLIGKDGKKIRTMEDGEIDRGGFSLIINNNVITTVLTSGMTNFSPASETTYVG